MTGPRSASTSISDLLIAGTVLGPHGVRGEVRVDIASDIPDRFAPGAVLDCDGIGPLTIEDARPGPRGTIVRFAGYASRPDVEPLRGRALRVPREIARKAAGDRVLWADLIGLGARDESGAALGTVRDVLRAGETDVLIIARPDAPDLLLPALASVVRSVDVGAGVIVIRPQEELE